MTPDKRQAVIAEAMTWLRTPWHHEGNVKGAGVDCAMLLVEVYGALGLIPPTDPRPYPIDVMLHRAEKNFLQWLDRYGAEVAAPQPGDCVVWHFGRAFSHGAIVVDWPAVVIHAYRPYGGVVLTRGDEGGLAKRKFKFYSLGANR